MTIFGNERKGSPIYKEYGEIDRLKMSIFLLAILRMFSEMVKLFSEEYNL
jgi:hypothetical protein